MKKDVKHTFVVCAYKESEYLEECIQSLKAQTINSAIIVYTSTPNLHIKKICDRYRLPLKTGKGGSIGKDWNNALSFVNTEYATIAHQDDLYQPMYAEMILKTFEKDSNCLIAFTDYAEWKSGVIIPRNLNLKIKHMMLQTMAVKPNSRKWRHKVLAFGNPICCPAVTYNLPRLNGFKFDEEMKVSLDWFAWYSIGQFDGSFRFINQKLMTHRIHGESETTNMIVDHTRTKEDLMMYRKFWPETIANLLMKYYAKSQETNN